MTAVSSWACVDLPAVNFRGLIQAIACRDLTQAITCPWLVVRGAESDVPGDEQATRFAAALPNGFWVKVQTAGHNVQATIHASSSTPSPTSAIDNHNAALMPSTLRTTTVAAVLDRLHAAAGAEDEPAKQRVRARETEHGTRLSQAQRYELYGEAPLAIKRDVGELLYLLALSRQARSVVEFGTSLGVSTLYLAAALKDCGGGTLITTELLTSKADAARKNLVDAGLDDLVELRVGDALHTLQHLDSNVELLFLDGRNDLYLDVLQVVEPHMAPAAFVAADLSVEDPDLLPYLKHVRDPVNGYFSVELPLDDGVELSIRTPQ